MEDLLLTTLEYLRGYRTYAHITAGYDVSESNICRGIRWVEDTLINGGAFSLPGRKVLLKSEAKSKIILVNTTKIPIAQTKKQRKCC